MSHEQNTCATYYQQANSDSNILLLLLLLLIIIIIIFIINSIIKSTQKEDRLALQKGEPEELYNKGCPFYSKGLSSVVRDFFL